MRLGDFLQILEKDTSIKIINNKEEVLVSNVKTAVYGDVAKYFFNMIHSVNVKSDQIVITLW